MTSQQIQTVLLDQKTQVIQYKTKTIENNFLDIGRELKEIRDNKIYKEKYESFEEYVKQNFVFTRRTADRMIQVVEAQISSPTNHLLSFSKWIELLAVPEDKRAELIEQAPNLTRDELREQIKEVNTSQVASDLLLHCEKCDKRFNSKPNFNRHTKVCIGNSCEKCGFVPSSKKISDLKRHLKTCKSIKKVEEEKQETIVEAEPEIIEKQNPFMEKEFDVFANNWQEMNKKTIPRLHTYISKMQFTQINKQRRKEAANNINAVIKQLKEIVHKLLP